MKIIGIDIGATKISGALTINNHIIKKYRTLTESHSTKNKILDNINTVIENLFDHDVKSIGIGIPGRTSNNKIVFMPNIKPLLNFNLKKYIERKFNLKTTIENDSICFTVAEHKYGAGKNYKNVIGLIIGTGIGSGLIINNQLYKGSNNSAGELGHNLILVDRELKEFESLCSGYNLTLRYLKESGKSRVVLPLDILQNNDKISRNIADITYKYLSINLANLINTLDPDIIVVGGGVSNSLDYKRLNKEVSKLVIHSLSKHVKIVKNKLGDDSGALGAACLANFS